MSLLDHFTRRDQDPGAPAPTAEANELDFPTKTLRKLASVLAARESATLVDLGQVASSNLRFFGEQLGCRISVEDVHGEIERCAKAGTLEDLPAILSARFAHADESVDGILCWDILEYLDKASAQRVAAELTRILRPDGVLLAFFSTIQPRDVSYTKFVVADESMLKCRRVPSTHGRLAVYANRDIIRLFERLRVSDSFLMKNNVREMLFRKPPSAPVSR